MTSPPPSPRAFPRAVSEEFMKRLVATERLRGICERHCILVLCGWFHIWRETPQSRPTQRPRIDTDTAHCAQNPAAVPRPKVLPETFVRQLIATQRLMNQYYRFYTTVTSWAFYRWEDSAAKRRLLAPSMWRQWRKLGRIGKKVDETNMIKACLNTLLMQQTLSVWREATATTKATKLSLGVALRKIADSKLLAAWNTWQFSTEEHWQQQITIRRVALRMRNLKVASALSTWRSTSTAESSKTGKISSIASKMLNSKLFSAWNTWRVAWAQVCHLRESVRNALLAYLSTSIGQALSCWRSMAEYKRSLLHQGFGHHLRAFVLAHGETTSDESPLLQLQDERLSETGRISAQQLGSRWPNIGGSVTVALVSPLARSIETALLVFGSPPSPVRILVEPALRDFEWDQSLRGELDLRHQGTNLSQLKKRFPQKNIKWDNVQAEEWWEPHGAFRGSIHSCIERVLKFKERILKNFMGHIAIVTHPRVFHLLTGSLVPRVGLQESACVVGRSTSSKFPDRVAVLPSTFAAAAQHERSKCIVVLVSPDPEYDSTEGVESAVKRRVWCGLERLCAGEDTVLLLVLSESSQMELVLRAMDEFPWTISEEEHGRVHVIGEDTHFDDVALATAAVLSVATTVSKPWKVHVLTDDWSAPRSLLLFSMMRDELGWASVTVRPILVPAKSQYPKTEVAKLFLAAVQAGASIWSQVSDSCKHILPRLAKQAESDSCEMHRDLLESDENFATFIQQLLECS